MTEEPEVEVAAEEATFPDAAPGLRAPFPWFGGKARVAHLVWERFGNVRNYVEPFAGSLAVLLGRPTSPAIETVNDADGYLANFWRAVQADPDQVAHWADGPVNECDLHARHRWLVETAAERVERVKLDPEYFDAKVAGWWVWGLCLWIGSGWCAKPEWTGRVNAGRASRGIHAGRPAGGEASASDLWQQRPDLSSGTGRGLVSTRLIRKLPNLGGDSKGVASRRQAEKRPDLTGHGGGNGVHRPGLGVAGWKKRPVLQHGQGGRGVHRLAHQIPDLSGDAGCAGRGIHADRLMGGGACRAPRLHA